MTEVNKSVRVDAELWQKARAKALGQRKTMQTLIKDLLTAYLEKSG